jgi:hypothetical protein
MVETTVVEDPEAVRVFAATPRTEDGRVSLRVGSYRIELNRWGTVLSSALVVGGPRLKKALRVLRIRRMKRPREVAVAVASAQAAVSTAVIAQPLDASSPVGAIAAKPDRATRRARRRVKRYASGPILVATEATAARTFLERALATSEPVVASYGNAQAVLTSDGSRAVLSLFAASKLRLAIVHFLLGGDRFRPEGAGGGKRVAKAGSADTQQATADTGAPSGNAESIDRHHPDPSDPWGPFTTDFPFSYDP